MKLVLIPNFEFEYPYWFCLQDAKHGESLGGDMRAFANWNI